jgi:hypothetical protein
MAGHGFLERPQEAGGRTWHRRRPSAAEVADAAASDTYPVFDLYLLARLSVQEAVDGESLDDQVNLGKRDAAAVLRIEQDQIAFVDADPDAIRERTGPLVRVSATYISGGAPWEQRADLREVIELARAGRVQAVMTPNLDRVARNVEVAHRFWRELVSAGVRTLFEGCVPYDLVDDNQQFIYGAPRRVQRLRTHPDREADVQRQASGLARGVLCRRRAAVRNRAGGDQRTG